MNKEFKGTPAEAENVYGEQPKCAEPHTAEADILGGQSTVEGSPLGKFKSVQDLLSAYNCLEAQFTRKCQKLSELEKLISTSKEQSEVATAPIEMSTDTAVAEAEMQPTDTTVLLKAPIDAVTVPEAVTNLTPEIVTVSSQELPLTPASKMDAETVTVAHLAPQQTSALKPQLIFETDNWQDTVSDFLIKNPEAQKYAKEISALILTDKIIASCDNPLEYAWAKVLSLHYKEPSKICDDEEFVAKYIIPNQNIREKILRDYLQQVTDQKAPPVIVKSMGSALSMTKKSAPKNLSDAAKIAQALLDV